MRNVCIVAASVALIAACNYEGRQGAESDRYAGNERWVDTRSGTEFFAALSDCASEQAGKPLVFGPDA